MRNIWMTAVFAVLCCVGCGGDDAAESAERQPLPVPKLSVAVEELTATVKWRLEESVQGVMFEYEIRADGAVVATDKSRQSSTRVEMSHGVTYEARVRALPAGDNALYDASPWSEAVTFASGMLAAPAVRVAELTPASVLLEWSAVAGATSYTCELYCGGELKESANGEEPSCGFDLDAATAYRARVRAQADDTHSEWSAFVEFTTPSESPEPDPNPELGLPLANENDGVIRAFPGAEGGGMYTTGGRGGKICRVTNLNDSGEGSFRDAVSQSGARTIVFEVAGTIELKRDITISNGNLTIAGQTAPGGGICISGGTVRVDADNIIIRYMRFRLGDAGSNLSDGSDAIWGRYHENIILDHCSMSWSIDECASFYANRNFTMQWCLLTESLRNSSHGKGAHGYGGIWGGRNASFHHNMLANHDSRNARIDHPGVYGSYLATHRGNVDFRNNVIYNWGSNTTYGGEDGAFNIVGNYYKPGPASKQRNYFVDAYWYNSSSNVGSAYPRLYMEGNCHAGSYASAINLDNWAGVYYHAQGDDPSKTEGRLSAPLAIRADDSKTCHTTTHVAEDAFERVVSYAGASLWRDEVDMRAERDSRNGTATYPEGSNGSKNGLIDSQSDVGGWPQLTATGEELARAATDSDGDGIPDYYEGVLGLDGNNAADAAAVTLDPQGLYSNFEVYLHWLVRGISSAQVAGGLYTELN